MNPAPSLPPATPSTVHVTPKPFVSPVIITLNCCDCVDSSTAMAGVMVIEITAGTVVVVVVVVVNVVVVVVVASVDVVVFVVVVVVVSARRELGKKQIPAPLKMRPRKS